MGNGQRPPQAPATRPPSLRIGGKIPSTTINKVCASGMKSVMLAATQIALGLRIVVCGTWSRCPTPHHAHLRSGLRLGMEVYDGVVFDGLWDLGTPAQVVAENAPDHNTSRDAQ